MNLRKWPVLAAVLCCSLPARADLASYLAKPEPAYRWEQKSLNGDANGTVQDLSMVSQTWQGMEWKHRIQVFRGARPAHPEFCLLYNTGGNGSAGETALGIAAAQQTGCTVAFLYNIPNQPLFGGKSEDALIVYTWQQFVKTNDDTWPLQFPMAKSVIKAMDAVQSAAVKASQPPVTKFLITGASKRGWTAWLAGASGDKRIKGIAPMVIDILNMPVQIPHQIEMYGQTSDMIRDYSQGGVLDLMDTPVGKRLIAMVDPYSMRATLAMPKLIILGTNDPYWSQDALNLYWDGLSGPKSVSYTPNSGHGLEDSGHMFATLSAFTRALAAAKPLPTPTWRWESAPIGAHIKITSDKPIASARLFRAESATRDFRKAKWSSTEITVDKMSATADAPAPSTGFAATFAEMTFVEGSGSFTLSTQMRILGARQ